MTLKGGTEQIRALKSLLQQGKIGPRGTAWNGHDTVVAAGTACIRVMWRWPPAATVSEPQGCGGPSSSRGDSGSCQKLFLSHGNTVTVYPEDCGV